MTEFEKERWAVAVLARGIESGYRRLVSSLKSFRQHEQLLGEAILVSSEPLIDEVRNAMRDLDCALSGDFFVRYDAICDRFADDANDRDGKPWRDARMMLVALRLALDDMLAYIVRFDGIGSQLCESAYNRLAHPAHSGDFEIMERLRSDIVVDDGLISVGRAYLEKTSTTNSNAAEPDTLRVLNDDRASNARRPPSLTSDAPIVEKPKWSAARSELQFRGKKRRYRPTAGNCRPILAVFEEEGWPPRIDDPLPRGPDGARLRSAVRQLNAGLEGMRFLTDGTGEGVLWEAIDG